MRRCNDAEGVVKNPGEPKSRRCDDAMMRRGLSRILEPKSRRCDDAEGAAKNSGAKFAKMRRCDDAKMRGLSNVHPALLYWCSGLNTARGTTDPGY